jgi:DNA-binding PadR family transcriptional regulator
MHGERRGEAWGPPHEEEGWSPPHRGHDEEEGWGPPHRGRSRGRGPGPRRAKPFGPGFGPRGFAGFGPWPGEPKFARSRRVRRGDVRAAALSLLAEEPRNGYQIIQGIAERSGGVWQPSPGSVYPALQQLEDEGLIQAETPEGGRRRYALTDEGRAYVEEHADEVRAPWDDVASSVGSDAIELRHLVGQVAMAAVQVVQVGTEDQVAQARKMLTDTRRKLYAILAAEDEPADE